MSDSGGKKTAPSLLNPPDGEFADLDDLRPSLEHEDDHSDPGFDLAAEIEAAAGSAAPVPAAEPGTDSAEALFPEFVRPCLDHEDDHSDADIDLDAEINRQLGEETPPEMRALEDSGDVHPGLRAALSSSYAFAVKGLAPDDEQDGGKDDPADTPEDPKTGSGAPDRAGQARAKAPDSRNLEGLGVDDDSRYAQEPEDSGDDDLPLLLNGGAKSAADESVAAGAAAGSIAAAGRDGDDGCADDDDPCDDDEEDDGEDYEDEDDGEDEDEDEEDYEDEEDEDEADGAERGAARDPAARASGSSASSGFGRGWLIFRLLLGLLLLLLLLFTLFSERLAPFMPPSVQDFMSAAGLTAQAPQAEPKANATLPDKALPATKPPVAPQDAAGTPAAQEAQPGASAKEPGSAPGAEPGEKSGGGPDGKAAASGSGSGPDNAPDSAPDNAPGGAPLGFASMAQLLPVLFFAGAFLFIIYRILAGERKIRTLSVKDYQASAREGSATRSPARRDGQGGSAKVPDHGADEEDDDGDDDRPMSFGDHFRELRKRFFRLFLFLLAGFFICWPFAEELFSLLTLPLLVNMPKGSTFIFTSPPEAFFTYMKVALVAGFFTASPLIFYQVWAFVAPGLYKEEKLYILPIAFFSAFFFIGGGAFCYYVVFPFAFEFFMSYNTGIIQAMPALSETLSFVLKLLIAFGLVFEMPLFAFFLGRMGLITAGTLRRFRRYAVLVLFIVAAILTPPDVVSQLLMAGPLLLLYEVSILIVAAVGKKEPDAENDDEAEDDDDEEDEEDEETDGGTSAGAAS